LCPIFQIFDRMSRARRGKVCHGEARSGAARHGED
jgi:hypothetical protein